MEPEPIDEVHAKCIEARLEIRGRVVALHAWVARWEPRPCPPQGRWP